MAKFTCKGCGNRSPGCHSTCPDYAIDKAFHEAERSEQSKEKEIDGGLTWQTMNSIAKINSKKRKGNSRFHEQ